VVEILGESLSQILLVAGVALAIAPGAHLISLRLALIVTGLVGWRPACSSWDQRQWRT
jgi:hypothetical protein